MLQIGSTLLASIQVELRDTIADAFQEDILDTIAKTGATGLVIDITGLDMVDATSRACWQTPVAWRR